MSPQREVDSLIGDSVKRVDLVGDSIDLGVACLERGLKTTSFLTALASQCFFAVAALCLLLLLAKVHRAHLVLQQLHSSVVLQLMKR